MYGTRLYGVRHKSTKGRQNPKKRDGVCLLKIYSPARHVLLRENGRGSFCYSCRAFFTVFENRKGA
jgi:hypothetical protein